MLSAELKHSEKVTMTKMHNFSPSNHGIGKNAYPFVVWVAAFPV